MEPRYFLRLVRWARNPPSTRRVKLIFAIAAIVLILAGLERMGLWPDALTAARMRP